MDFNLTAEQRLLREGAVRYLREQYSFGDYRKLIAGSAAEETLHWGEFSEMGWLGLSFPDSEGGVGCSFLESAILAEELGRALVLEPYVSGVVLCGRIVERGTSSKVRCNLLPQLIEGRLHLALAHTELDARFDFEQPGLTSVTLSGERFILKGSKILVLAGPSANWLIVSAKLEGELALFAVRTDAPGVRRRNYQLLDRTGASDFDFEDVTLDKEALVASGNAAVSLLDESIDRATLALVAQTLGVMEAAVEATSEHVKNRVQFEQPLGKLQAVQHMMAESFIELQETRSMLYRGLADIESATPLRRSAVSAAKAYAGRAGKIVGANCVQLHGGYGITEEYLVAHCYRKLVLLEKLFGDTEYHTERVAEHFLPAA